MKIVQNNCSIIQCVCDDCHMSLSQWTVFENELGGWVKTAGAVNVR